MARPVSEPDERRWWKQPARGGFTLIELGVVMAIIGILVTFILRAGSEGVRRAEERATQGLIAKLDWGVTQRLDALLQTPPDSPNGGHQWLAAINPPTFTGALASWGVTNDPPTQDRRAMAIALYDYIKMEMPDVFVVNTAPGNDDYAFNFAALAWPMTTGSGTPVGLDAARDPYVLPVGHMGWAYRYRQNLPSGTLLDGPGDLDPGEAARQGITDLSVWTRIWRSKSRGIFGASYTVRGGFNKLLGSSPRGFDAKDNDLDGWIDEWDECTGGDAAVNAQMLQRLSAHTHKTARSEALYALLVEGIGPLGSFFSPDDFGPREVGDTDGDGLPEFIDAWGEPLQFYRWPVHHN